MKKETLATFSWAAILTEYLFERVPLGKDTGPVALYEAAAEEYLSTYPDSVPNAIETAVVDHGEYADADHVIARLEPPFLDWARAVKKMELNDFEAPLYWYGPKPK